MSLERLGFSALSKFDKWTKIVEYWEARSNPPNIYHAAVIVNNGNTTDQLSSLTS